LARAKPEPEAGRAPAERSEAGGSTSPCEGRGKEIIIKERRKNKEIIIKERRTKEELKKN